jgi:hypothetical protein
MYRLIALLALTCAGCAGTPSYYAEVSQLRGNREGTGELPQSTQVLPLDGTLARIGGRIDLTDPGGWGVEVGAGLQTAKLHGQAEPSLGPDVGVKVSYDFDGLRPFVEMTAGFLTCPEAWDPYRSDYFFSNGLTIGLEYEISDNTSLLLGYSVYHASNGADFHGKGRLNKFGLDPKGPNPGFEGGGFMIGIEVTF